jgi:hypothetical protein
MVHTRERNNNELSSVIDEVHGILMQAIETEVHESQVMEDKLVMLLEETC